ncbi:MAG: hypothetical protein KJ053_07875 [Dehalococcoidia bacterium]|nr:hypothetical protein [Dehalococcoidia bacterium]
MSEPLVARVIFRPVVGALARAPLPPAGVTLLFALLASGAGAAVASGREVAGGAAVVVAALVAAIPGELARQGQPGRPFARVLHAVTGRYADAAVLGGMTVYAVRFEEWPRAEVVGGLALASTLVVAYATARVEASLGAGSRTSAPGSFLVSDEIRWAVAAVGAFTGQCYWALAVVGASGGIATAWRLAYLRLRRVGLEP